MHTCVFNKTLFRCTMSPPNRINSLRVWHDPQRVAVFPPRRPHDGANCACVSIQCTTIMSSYAGQPFDNDRFRPICVLFCRDSSVRSCHYGSTLWSEGHSSTWYPPTVSLRPINCCCSRIVRDELRGPTTHCAQMWSNRADHVNMTVYRSGGCSL